MESLEQVEAMEIKGSLNPPAVRQSRGHRGTIRQPSQHEAGKRDQQPPTMTEEDDRGHSSAEDEHRAKARSQIQLVSLVGQETREFLRKHGVQRGPDNDRVESIPRGGDVLGCAQDVAETR